MIYVFLAEGFEELEAMAPVDVLRRAGAEVRTVAIGGARTVNGAHGVPVLADCTMSEADFSDLSAAVLPGGWPGYDNLGKSAALSALLRRAAAEGKLIAAICGAPSVLGGLGLLQGQTATCYPGMEHTLEGARISREAVVESGQFITSRGAGTAVDFALALAARCVSPEKAAEIRRGIVYR